MKSRTSRRIIIATKGGHFSEVIDLARQALTEDPNDIEALYHLAQGLEWAGEPEAALPYAERAISILPTFVDLTLAARCAVKSGFHDRAYSHARVAIANYSEETNQLPSLARAILWLVSWIPGFRGTRTTHTRMKAMNDRDIGWLNDYVDWYEKQSNAT